MINPHPNHFRILALAPSTRGVGFAVLEGKDSLVDWGVKSVKGDKNSQSLLKIEALIAAYQPGALVFQDFAHKDSRRSARIRTLGRQVVEVAAKLKVSVTLFSNEQVRQVFFEDGQGTKHAIAEVLAQRFPEELGFQLPPKRKLWESEDHQMAVFDAVALVLVYVCRRQSKL